MDGFADSGKDAPSDTARARAEPSRTEHVRRGGGRGGGVGKAVALILVLAAFAAGAFYVGRTYFAGATKGDAPKADAAVQRTIPDQAVARPDQGKTRRPLPKSHHGLLQVSSKPSGAEIRLCGKRTGQVTPAALPLRRGRRCRLELRLRGYEVYRLPVRLRGAKPLTVTAVLTPKPGRRVTPTPPKVPSAPVASKGELVVTSIQVGVVKVNGRTMGQTPRLKLDLKPGRYRVSVSFPTLGVSSSPRLVTIVAGKRANLHFNAEP